MTTEIVLETDTLANDITKLQLDVKELRDALELLTDRVIVVEGA